MSKYILVHELHLPHQLVTFQYNVLNINDEYVETEELGKLPTRYLSTCDNVVRVNGSSIFFLAGEEDQKRQEAIKSLKSQLVEFLKVRTQYCDEIDNIKGKIEHIDLKIKDISNEMKRIAEGGTLNVK